MRRYFPHILGVVSLGALWSTLTQVLSLETRCYGLTPAFDRLVPESLPSNPFATRPESPTEACLRNPFLSPGYLTSSPSSRWNPFAVDCTTPSLHPLVLARTQEDMEWLQGRTVLIWGNSVDRLRVLDLCDIVNGTYTIYPHDSPLSPPRTEPGYPTNWTISMGIRPRTCYVEAYDFMIVSGFNLGHDETGVWRETWRAFDPPELWIDRWEMGFVPFVRNLGRTRIDIVAVGHFEWDIQVCRSLPYPSTNLVADR